MRGVHDLKRWREKDMLVAEKLVVLEEALAAVVMLLP